MMNKLLLTLFAAIVLVGCTDSTNAERVLKENGYSDITITGYKIFGCGKDDIQHTGFKAKGPTGIKTSGVVCSGLIFKGSTVRLD